MKWFDTKEVDSFAQWVVTELLQRLPPASLEGDERKLHERIARMNDFISGRATSFAVEQRPNFYKRARLANRVKWALQEAGYPSAFANTFTYELATLITVTARRRR
jgi:hypothetical protein